MSFDTPTRLDVYALGRGYLQSTAKKIDPTIIDVEGSDANIVVGSTAVMATAVVNHLGYAVAALTLDGAENDDLDRLAWDRYQIARKGASPAIGTVVFSRPSFAAGLGTIRINTRLRTVGGAEYITTSAASFGATDLAAFANVRAATAGKATQVGANNVRGFSVPSDSFDPTIQLTNPAATAGGEDREDDETFRNRIRQFWTTVRRGTLAAIEFGALTVPGVVSAQAVEVITATALPARAVLLYIADSSGVASAALAQKVAEALLDFRACGIAVLIQTSIPTIVPVLLHLAFLLGSSASVLTDAIRAAVVAYVNSLPVNTTLTRAGLFTVLSRFIADGLVVNDGALLSPAADVVPPVGTTLRTTLASVAVA